MRFHFALLGAVCAAAHSLPPLRMRTASPMPNSVIGGSLFQAECANNTWVPTGICPQFDSCDPYANVDPSNNDSRALWFSFETQHAPSMYMIYSDPASGTCGGTSTVPAYNASPIAGTVVSLWTQCYYSMPQLHPGDSCGSEPVEGMADDHGFVGPLCLAQDTLYYVRVRGDTPEDAGDYDLTIEEWTLRRGGDTCAEARPLEPDSLDPATCRSALYTNLCAPPADVDLHTSCPAVALGTQTTWFSYETRSFGNGPLSLSFSLFVNDSRSLTVLGSVPFAYLASNGTIPINFTLGLWSSCEIASQTPLLCETRSGVLNDSELIVEFATPIVISESALVLHHVKRLRPHTTYYVSISTNTYVGDYALCVDEVQPPQCVEEYETDSTCADLCAITPCNDSVSLNSVVHVQRFDSPPFYRGYYGSAINDHTPGVDIVAHGFGMMCMQPMLFDPSNMSGDDCELATPNRRFGGLGCGVGGAEGYGVNFRSLGLCLIVSEDGNDLDPDSLRRRGATLVFTFCSTVQLEYIVFINARSGTRMTFFDPNGEDYPTRTVQDLGANSVYNLTLDDPNYAPLIVSKMEIEFGDGGSCIPEFAYRVVNLNALCGCNSSAPMPYVGGPARGSGACCYNGGRACVNAANRAACDSVQHGLWYVGRDCSEGTFCPNNMPQAGEYFGWQHDNTPIDTGYDLKHTRGAKEESSSSSSSSSSSHHHSARRHKHKTTVHIETHTRNKH